MANTKSPPNVFLFLNFGNLLRLVLIKWRPPMRICMVLALKTSKWWIWCKGQGETSFTALPLRNWEHGISQIPIILKKGDSHLQNHAIFSNIPLECYQWIMLLSGVAVGHVGAWQLPRPAHPNAWLKRWWNDYSTLAGHWCGEGSPWGVASKSHVWVFFKNAYLMDPHCDCKGVIGNPPKKPSLFG